MRKEQSELRKKRKLSEDENFELASKALRVWNELRDSRTEKLRREQLIDQLLAMLKDNLKNFVRKHDTARVIQSIVKHGNAAQRTVVFDELKDSVIEFSKMKFARFFVTKMSKYGNAQQRQYIVKSMYGHVKVLLRHAVASSVLETVYNEVANAQQRSELVQEYYGPEFSLFKDEHTIHLHDAIVKMDETKSKKVIAHLKDELNNLCNKTAIKMSITHFLLREFYKNADSNDKHELSQSLADKVVEILHTKDGSRAAIQCIWNGSAKERKVIVKSFKKLVPAIAKEEHGHYVLLALFDTMDDTKLLEKGIIEELFEKQQITELIQNEYSFKVLMYLLCPRDRHYFHPDVLAILTEGDSNTYSKKDREVRANELRQVTVSHLLDLASNNLSALFETSNCGLLLETLQKSPADRYAVAASLVADYVISKGEVVDGDIKHPIFQSKQEFMLRKLIKFERASQEANEQRSAFSERFASQIPDSVLSSYLKCQKSCFILLLLLETQIPNVLEELGNKLKVHTNLLFESQNKGAELLYKRLQTILN